MGRRLTAGRLGALVVAGAAAAYYARKTLTEAGGPLRSVLHGESSIYNWRGHKISFNKRGVGRPLILLHGVYATAWNAEMQEVFERFADDFTVYAPDLIGFGRSARPSVDYTDKLYINQIRDFIREVVGGGAIVVASSLTAAYATEIAAREPSLISKLILIEPTGMTTLVSKPTPAAQLWYRTLKVPYVGDNLFFALTSRRSLRTFLETRVYFNRRKVTDELVEDHYRAAHQPGGKWAPLAFIAGKLNHNVRFTFPLLNIPTVIVKGVNSSFSTDTEIDQFLRHNSKVDFHEFDKCGALPHDEQAEAFHAFAREWLLHASERAA
ncbi:MAG: alpha/beta fold hydrolase [Candidatus Aquicultorales bacterium]